MLRKLLILSREAGVGIDEKDVEISSILPEEFFEGDVEAFYAKLAENEEMFERAAKYLRKLVKEQQQQADPTVDVLSAYGHYDDK